MKQWGDPGTYLILWDCDDVCDCHQVQLHTRGPAHGFKSFLLNSTNVGTFHSEPESEDWIDMKKEFEAAIEKHKPDFIQKVDWPDVEMITRKGEQEV